MQKSAKKKNDTTAMPLSASVESRPDVVSTPIFKFGDRVQRIEGILKPDVPNVKGDVMRHDMDDQNVFVNWDDGTKYWIGATCLMPAAVKKKRTYSPEQKPLLKIVK